MSFDWSGLPNRRRYWVEGQDRWIELPYTLQEGPLQVQSSIMLGTLYNDPMRAPRPPLQKSDPTIKGTPREYNLKNSDPYPIRLRE
jgi:hypothetical protein